MLSAYTIHFDKRLVSVRFVGKLTFPDIESYATRLRADRRFNPEFFEIVDLTRVEEVELSAKQCMILSDRIDPFLPSSKRAFVVSSQTQIHAPHIHRILREGGNIRVFFSRAEAHKWIEAPAAMSRAAE